MRPITSPFQIRPLRPADIPTVTAWARREGFTPGVGDVAIYRQTDRQGLWVGWLGDEPIGCIAGVRYNDIYGFIGLFLVVPEQRGRGYGVRLWRHALAHLADLRCIGLEAAPERVDDYAGWGFVPASPTTRWRRDPEAALAPRQGQAAGQAADLATGNTSRVGPIPATGFPGQSISSAAAPAAALRAEASLAQGGAPPSAAATVIPTARCEPAAGEYPAATTALAGVNATAPAVDGAAPAADAASIGAEWCLLEGRSLPEAAVQRFDALREPSPRPHFLHQWLRHPAGTVLALRDRRGACHGFGRIRPCLLQQGEGWRIGPLVADDPAVAAALLAGLLQRHPGVALIDAPAANPAAAALLSELGFRPVSSTLRMYRGSVPAVGLAEVYGLACLELG